jgi:glutamate--cysteine ligase
LYSKFHQRLSALQAAASADIFQCGGIGLEKESLRVSKEGVLAQTAHPDILGAALTNPYITTDYSEALLEFITPPFADVCDALDFLRDTQQFVYDNLEDELLWSASMPCVVAGETSIPLAKYGPSNLGQMKTVYRRGLGHRYGRVMQVIAGVHYNYSFKEEFWQHYQSIEQDKGSLQDFTSSGYFDALRNLQRYGWLIPYLFGASPAICKSFLNGQKTSLQEYNENSYYEPFATSLRLGEIGYRNSRESEVGIKANYNSLPEYIETLRCAIETPYAGYDEIGKEVEGVYQQLNTNILQIENEYYSSVRPKQILQGLEKPVNALRDRGVQYLELRSVDVNPFDPLGVNEQQLRFIQLFIIFCCLQESPAFDATERKMIDENLLVTAHRGREPGLMLETLDGEKQLTVWAHELVEQLLPLADMLDAPHENTPYRDACEAQFELINDAEKTPSATILRMMNEENEGFYHFSKRMSDKHHQYFNDLPADAKKKQFYRQAADESWSKQQSIEAADEQSFEDFLNDYFNKH